MPTEHQEPQNDRMSKTENERRGGVYKKERKVSTDNIDQALNQYEYLKDNYDYIIEEECLIKSLSPNVFNSSSADLNRANRFMFRRRSNPLYIKSYQENPINKHKIFEKKYLPYCLILIIIIIIIIILFILSSLSIVMVLKANLRLRRVEEIIITSRNTSEPIVIIEENHYYQEKLRNHSQLIESNRRDHRSLLRELESLELEVLKMMNKTRFLDYNVMKLKNQEGLNFDKCYYKTKENGNSATQRVTQTDQIPERGKNVSVTGVHCSVDGGTSAILKFTGSQYYCTCAGQSHGESRFCKIHYWYCTHSD